jgi:hypothetical protein
MKHAPLHVIHKATPLVLAVSGVLELCVSEPQWRGKAVWRHSLLEAAALRAARRRCDKSALRSHPGIPRLSHTSSRCQTAPGEEQLAGRRELKARGAMHHGGLASRRAAEYLEGRRRAGMKAPYCGSLLPPGAPPPSKSATSSPRSPAPKGSCWSTAPPLAGTDRGPKAASWPPAAWSH